MASSGWRTDTPLERTLHEEPWRFEYRQALRLLELSRPGKKPLGVGIDPGKEAVRICSDATFGFPASDISRITAPESPSDPAVMDIGVIGLAGGMGPLPAVYTELIQERLRRKDTAFKAFLDMFNHRLASLLYRMWKTHRPGFEWVSPERSHLARYLFSFIGLGTEGLRGRMRVPDRSLLFGAGILFQRPRSMTGLEALLTHHFGIPCRGRQLVGRWLALSSDQVTVMGRNGRNNHLGRDVIVGGRVWDQQGKIRLIFGPMTFQRFLDFLPTGTAFASVGEFVRFYAGDQLEMSVELVLAPEEVPSSRVGGGKGPLLGWTSWISDGRKRSEPGRVSIGPTAS